ncbi:MAG: L-seryl-tRNA(Sec) selenium transferase [Chloroflexi bacterium]|nr:L-seryl-tRNA(Sec) selenium transferase [Chloroflexota bacterium]MBU1749046.1 L-seryl-tRNA(Sec) selenium transferase [Chloroflexota bacterium]MBU1879622.1 L-seryl-tRNA(Sec) selenium transferase [Chloroflexota bacterium]
MSSEEAFRALPSVDKLLQQPAIVELVDRYSQPPVVEIVRRELMAARAHVAAGEPAPTIAQLVQNIVVGGDVLWRPSLYPVINATGVVLHTNLGRAPLSRAALAAIREVGRGYSNLEYDLDKGQRGSRYVHAEELLCHLTGAPAALVVNNNAAAVLLTLTVLAQGGQVVISRGQLIEIGGGFRIPEVMQQSGCTLVEVGTTNRTYRRDYEAALTPQTRVLMRAHRSNFSLAGFVEEPSVADLAALAREHNLRVVDDLGSGTLLDTAQFGLAHEPTVPESVQAGADIVSFSGDKLLGGPQAGILLGAADLIAELRHCPMTRALRVDKTTLAALQATLLSYLRGRAVDEVPIWQMIGADIHALEARAEGWAQVLTMSGVPASVMSSDSTVGGGSLPGQTLPTRVCALAVESPDRLAAYLRAGDPPVVGRIENDRFLLDPRTVLPDQDNLLLEALRRALATG